MNDREKCTVQYIALDRDYHDQNHHYYCMLQLPSKRKMYKCKHAHKYVRSLLTLIDINGTL